jgi:anti-sigma regulatory factor (Ser/Thr protein kinase)/putative methionine-R-sulfoxide reductase with GAF domain
LKPEKVVETDVARGLQAGEGQVFLGTAGVPPPHLRDEQLRDMYRLGDATLSDLSLGPLLNELLVRVQEIIGVDTVAILLIDEEGKELVATAAKGLEEEVGRGVRVPVGRGFAGRVAATRSPIYIADVDRAEILNPILREKRLRSLLGVPLISEGQVVGVLHVGTLEPRLFTNEDAAILQLAAARAAPAIAKARLVEALDREHRAAVALQRSLLPDRLPEIVGVSLAGRYLPARDEVGGDWYDVIELTGGRVGVAIGDVVGHGVRAAALMGQLRIALRAYALEGYEPRGVFERLDRLLQTISRRGMATAAYGVLDPETGAFKLAIAGHPPPVMIPADGEPQFVEVDPSPPLGTLDYSSYLDTELTLGSGDGLLFYTDGLVEVRGESLDIGLERLLATVPAESSPEETCDAVTRELVPPDGAADDVALVALQNMPVPLKLALRFLAEPDALAQVRQALRRWLRMAGADEDEVTEITLACGEACANAIEHAYSPTRASFELEAGRRAGLVEVTVRDDGQWRAPRGQNRGRGLEIIEATMDEVDVKPTEGGTEVRMRRRLRAGA